MTGGRDGWRHQIGRRGAVLLVLAATDTAYGAALLAGYAPGTVATDIAPAATWATIWLVTAIIVAAAALSPADQIGYAAATLLKFSWSAAIFAAHAKHPAHGGWGPAVPWLALAGLIIVTAGWPETRR